MGLLLRILSILKDLTEFVNRESDGFLDNFVVLAPLLVQKIEKFRRVLNVRVFFLGNCAYLHFE